MDLVSEQLHAVHLSGGVFFRASFSAPFSVESPSPEHIARLLELGSRRVVPLHLVVEGRCEGRVDGLETIPLEAGDVVVFLNDGTHVMASTGASGSTPIAPLLPPPPYDRVQPIDHGGGGAVTRLICGFLHHDAAFFSPLLRNLPRVLAVSSSGERHLPVGRIFQLIEEETSAARPGGSSLLARLTELLFVQVLRQYIEELPDGEGGWLAGLRDPFVCRALGLLHGDPAGDWSLDELSRKVGLSRSALSERFTSLVGLSPMRYLTSVRMQQATQLLRTTDITVSGVASRVGYRSDVAFSRAFRRVVGAPPATWRRQGSVSATRP